MCPTRSRAAFKLRSTAANTLSTTSSWDDLRPAQGLARPSVACLSVLALLFASQSAMATNGMNLEAYGALAGGMGGASFAHDQSNSSIMNNPATLGLRTDNSDDIGIGITLLMPDVTSSHPMAGESASSGDLYLMPTLSWIRSRGNFTFGAGIMAQGGMGTEYGDDSALFAGGLSMMGTPAPLSGQEIRSEVGVGRLMFPLAFKATDRLTLAAQLDYVWATMDVKMDVDGQTFGRMVQQTPNLGAASGGLVNAFNGAMAAGQLTNVNYARFEFSDSNDFSGAAKGQGLAGKLGIHFKLSNSVSLGATYHTKTAIDDLETDSATISMGVVTPMGSMDVPVKGRIKVVDFQWPETFGFGIAWQATPQLLLVSDIKRLRWSDAMKNFTLRFQANSTQSNPMAQGLVAAGGDLESTLNQNWKDQTVFMIGGEYRLTPSFALRAGYNYASNPVPDNTMNPLFPAIETRHFTLGFGWSIDKANNIAASLAIAPEVEQTNTSSGITSSHSQHTLRINYNHRF